MKEDSIDKIVKQLGMVCKKPFTYKGNVYIPKTMKLNSSVRRGFTCPAKCGSCCGNWSLDYIPPEQLNTESLESRPPIEFEEYAKYFIRRTVNVNGKEIEFITDPQGKGVHQQTDKPDGCRYLNADGRCDIHNFALFGDYGQPFSCDFEITRFISPSGQKGGHIENAIDIVNIELNPENSTGRIGTDYYMYARLMKDINGKSRENKPVDHDDFKHMSVEERPGPKCGITDVDEATVADTVRKFSRMLEWAEYLGIETWLPEMIVWIRDNEHIEGDYMIINAKNMRSSKIRTNMIPWSLDLVDGVLEERRTNRLF
ncbi:hypothetical protein HJ044_04975 [Vibrio parahaemolyticus]|nr:hypothetical protein [Vibrio parahaemolyticus]